jgi:hypothetical protein
MSILINAAHAADLLNLPFPAVLVKAEAGDYGKALPGNSRRQGPSYRLEAVAAAHDRELPATARQTGLNRQWEPVCINPWPFRTGAEIRRAFQCT